MGSVFSRTTNDDVTFNSFSEMLDYISTHYILTMDFENLKKLSDPEYCNSLITITSDIISKYFNELDVDYLAQRIKDGQEINEMTKDKIVFFTKNDLENFDIKNDRTKSIRKKRVCIGIAKFYIMIASLYAAIVTTLNPVYTFKDETGQIVKKGWADKNNIPSNAIVENTNICDDRIKALSVGLPEDKPNTNVSDGTSTSYNLNPNICSFNSSRNALNLLQEPGINELKQLYYDKYDYSTGTFNQMSDEAKKQYNDDLKLFYFAFTGKSEMPEDIKEFSNIMLQDFEKRPNCLNGDLKKPISVTKNEKLYVKYADHIKEMIKKSTDKQRELISVLNSLFMPITDPYKLEKKIKIHPGLTDDSLKKIVKKTRKIIVEMYSTCEKDFVKGVELYEAIVETKIKHTLENQINSLESDKKQLVDYKMQMPSAPN
jgi:hypothetical protein